jgi:DNA-directed RNA polymerase specialized sigma54-like protein
MTGFPGRTQYLIDEALVAAAIADASQSNIEIVIAVVHRCDPGGIFLRQVPE